MAKITFTEEQTNEIIRLYTVELLGALTIGKQYGVGKSVIINLLRANDVEVSPSGRKNTGGKAAADKRYREKNKEKLDEYHKEWAKDNRGHLREYHTKWRNENREHLNEYCREYSRNKMATNPKHKLCVRTRTAVSTCLKEANVAKYRSTFDILGYSLEELMVHLEALFTSGMTWDNYGIWHVDHKIPMSSFEFESTEDKGFKDCWKLDNLQPLWGVDNFSKGTRIL